ncbi:MAG TPA: carboxypeptidase regulatory-like domain-containing protein [Terriglobales bacterium]|nr:carboxypeptidase regulatory-like domain-containing protein [Terriglobales bacterium]
MRIAWGSLLLALLCLTIPAAAQFSGEVTGTVTDASGAVVSGATVRVVNSGTGEERTTQANDQGQYTIPNLAVGTYEVHVTHPGFSEVVTKDVDLHVSTVSTVNAQLKVGQLSESVSVEANALQVQTEDASLGAVVDGRQLRELPMNGRNFVGLTQLQPGVSAGNNLNTIDKGVAGGIDFAVNGNSTDNNLFLVDGSVNNDRGSNRTLLVYPSVESITEFKILTNSYGPEYGQAAGAIVNIVTRGGTNQFHGEAFYFGRNDVLNARSFAAANATSAAHAAGQSLPNDGKDVLIRNDFGYRIGGPVKKDKLFFYWSQEWNLERRGQTRNSCVPTVAERAGDFTNNPANPETCMPGSGASFTPDPAGALFLQQFPLPTQTTLTQGKNWFQAITGPFYWRQENARGDFNLTKSNQVMVRYTQDHWSNKAPDCQNCGFWGDDNLPGLESNWVSPARSLTAKLTSTVTSTMVNDVAFNYSYNAISNTIGGTGGVDVDQGNAVKLAQDIDAAIPPVFDLSLKTQTVGVPWLGFGGGGQYFGGGPTWVQAPWSNNYDLYSVRDDLSKVKGAHTFKVGVSLDWNKKNEQNGGHGSTQYPQIGGVPTGANPVESLLTPGFVFDLNENSSAPVGQARWQDYEFYVGDSWKIRRNVTVEYGARYSIMREPYAANNAVSRFDPAFYDPTKPVSDACNGVVVVPGTDPCGDANAKFGTNFSSGTPGPNRALMENNNHLIAPRLGIAWDVFGNGKTAIRAGAGQFFQREHVNIFTNEAGNAPFSINTTVQRTLSGPSLTLPLPPGAGSSSPNIAKNPRAVVPNSWQWNFTVEQEISRATTFQLGYVGNRGIHLNSEDDTNQPLPADRLQAAFGNVIRPMPTLGSFFEFARQGDSSYNALQTQLRSRVGSRLQLQVAYTFSHTIANQDINNGGTNNPQPEMFRDTFNHRLDRGNSTVDRPHVFVANAVISAPSLHGSNPFAKAAFAGWEISPIFTATSGTSRDVVASTPTDVNAPKDENGNPIATIASLSGTAPPQNNVFPLRVPGKSCALHKGNQIYDPAAFTLVGFRIGEDLGNTGRGYCEGPTFINFDLGIHKNFPMPFLGEQGRIQFRFDAFNLFNHANFIFIPSTSNAANISQGTTVACGTTACSPTNNVITSWSGPPAAFGNTSGTQIPRQFQFALKLIF